MIFSFDWRDFRDAYQDQGWVIIPGGASDEVCAAVLEALRSHRADEALAGKGITGAKDQYLFDLPAGAETEEVFDVVAGLCGLNRATMTLSERHIKAYAADADPDPVPHKDRLASQVAVGISVSIPEGSQLVLYPDDHREINPFLSTGLRDSLAQDQLPETALRGCREVVVHDHAGDVMIFPGSSVWHLRRRSAGTVNLYLKVNDFESDPLGEDPQTASRQAATAALVGGGRDALLAAVPRLSRRFDSVVCERSRVGWQERKTASVWGVPPVPISDRDESLIRALDGRATVADIAGAGGHREGDDAAVQALRRLAERGVIDLVTTGAQ
jgi:hypothetical protein